MPLERLGDGLVVALETEDGVGQSAERREVDRRKDLALQDREVDLDLIEPTGVDGSLNQDEVRMLTAKPLGGLVSTVRGAVVDNPEDSSGLAIGAASHGLSHQSVEGDDAVLALAAAEELGAVDIERGQVDPGSEPFVLVLDLHDLSGLRGPRRVLSGPGLDAGLLIRADDILVTPESAALPDALVKVEDAAGLFGEVRVTGKDPGAVIPGADGVSAEPTPDGCIADRSGQAGTAHLGTEFGNAPARQRDSGSRWQLAGEGLNLNDQLWGGTPGGAPAWAGPRDPAVVSRRSVFASDSRFLAWY